MSVLTFLTCEAGKKEAAIKSIMELPDDIEYIIEIKRVVNKRTLKQNRAMHKFFFLLSKALNDAGLDMKKVLKPETEIPWTETSVKNFLWKPLQLVMFNKESTADLETVEVGKVYEVINRKMSENFNLHIPFPEKLPEEYEQLINKDK